MINTYFDYVISQCRLAGIGSICAVYPTRKTLIENANKSFSGCKNVTADWRLLNVVSVCLQNHDIIEPNILNQDALSIYERCQRLFLQSRTFDSAEYNKYFDGLVDLCWLLASVQITKENNQRTCILESDPSKIREYLKRYLLELYNSSITDFNECVFIQEAMNARKKFFSGLYDFQYEESKKYLSYQDFSITDLDELLDEYKENSISKMALFYGLTATSALAENIRRGLC